MEAIPDMFVIAWYVLDSRGLHQNENKQVLSHRLRMFDRFIFLSQFVGLLQPLLHLPPVDVVFGSHRSLVAFADRILVITLDGAQFKVQTVAVSLFEGHHTLDVISVVVTGTEGPDLVLGALIRRRKRVVVTRGALRLQLVQRVRGGVLRLDVADVIVVVVIVGRVAAGEGRAAAGWQVRFLGGIFGDVVEVGFEEFDGFGGAFLVLPLRGQVPHVWVRPGETERRRQAEGRGRGTGRRCARSGPLERQVHRRGVRGAGARGEIEGRGAWGLGLVVRQSGAPLALAHAVAQVALDLEPLLDLAPVDAVLPGRGPLVALAVGVVPVRIQHLKLEMRGEDAAGADASLALALAAHTFQYRIQAVGHPALCAPETHLNQNKPSEKQRK
jgi:hypothetical protein